MSSKRGRPSFLRPLTQIAPPEPHGRSGSPSLETSRGSIASASFGVKPRSKSLAVTEDATKVRHATPVSSVGGATPASFSTQAPSRSSSFAPGHRRPSMSASAATMSRRGSMWSSFAEEAATSNGVDLTPEEKVMEARKAFASAVKILWENGVQQFGEEFGDKFKKSWTSGDILSIFSLDALPISHTDRARATVLLDDLKNELSALGATSFAIPGVLKSLFSSSVDDKRVAVDKLLDSPVHLSLLLNALATASKLLLRTLPAAIVDFEAPESLRPAISAVLGSITFLAGSSKDLRRAVLGGFRLFAEVLAVLENASRAAISIQGQVCPPTSIPTLIPHPVGGYLFSKEYTEAQFAELRDHLVLLISQPSFASAYNVFAADLEALGEALIGNARVARAVRGATRIFASEIATARTKLVSFVGALDVVGWKLDAIKSETDEFTYTFDNLAPKLGSLVPEDVDFTFSPRSSAGESAPNIVTLRGMRLRVENATYDITKRGLLGFSDKGHGVIDIPFDLSLDLTSSEVTGSPSLSVKMDVAKAIVTLKTSSGTPFEKVWNSWLSIVVKAKLGETFEAKARAAFVEWIAPLYDPIERTPRATPRASKAPKAYFGNMDDLVRTPSNVSISSNTSGTGLAPKYTGPIGARAAFLRSLRMSSGAGPRVAGMPTGREVLESLSDPFGGSQNLSAVDDDDDESATADPTPAEDFNAHKARRMSMAMSLTDIAMSDSTSMEHIQNPPRARSLSQVEMDLQSEPEPFEHARARRLSLAYTPAGEPSLEAYDEQHSATAIDEYEAAAAQSRPQSSLMANCLTDVTERDETTPEGLLARSARSRHGFAEDHHETRENKSMSRLMSDLLTNEDISEESEETLGGRPALTSTKSESAAVSSTKDRYSEAARQVEQQQPMARRKSMSEYLTQMSMIDETDPTLRPGERRPSAPQEEAIHSSRRSMSEYLDELSSRDMTLPENIHSPPSRSGSSIYQSPGGGSSSSVGFRPRTKSFMALHDTPSMSELGIDERITADHTESGTPGARRKSNATEEYAGIHPDELKKRRMSSFATEASMMDATLLENIRTPPSVDQSHHEVSAQPHSLHARRQSSITSH